MKLMRVGPVGEEKAVLQDIDGRHYDISHIVRDIDPAFFAKDGIGRCAAALATGQLTEIDVSKQRIGAPVANPSVVLCIGMNYAAHANESGAKLPKHPIVFYKPPNTLVGPDDDVKLPHGATKLDWEVELAVVIGKRARYLTSPNEAPSCIAGYAISNDVSERAFQLEVSGGQWSKGKGAETFNPLGPWLVTADEVRDPGFLWLRSWVNGEARQDSNTADLIFSVPSLIYHLSQFTVLEPGDIINTGTPEGVALSGRFPYLTVGDVMEMEIEGLGHQRQKIVSA